MEKQEREKLYQEAIDFWGKTAQYDQCIEEMAELTVAINKLKRKTLYGEFKDKDMEENVVEELADVFMCIEQIIGFFDKQKFDEMLDNKLNKLKNILNNCKNNN